LTLANNIRYSIITHILIMLTEYK